MSIDALGVSHPFDDCDCMGGGPTDFICNCDARIISMSPVYNMYMSYEEKELADRRAYHWTYVLKNYTLEHRWETSEESTKRYFVLNYDGQTFTDLWLYNVMLSALQYALKEAENKEN